MLACLQQEQRDKINHVACARKMPGAEVFNCKRFVWPASASPLLAGFEVYIVL